jgi:hypothetical protein
MHKTTQCETSYTLLCSFWNTSEGDKRNGKAVPVYAMMAYRRGGE